MLNHTHQPISGSYNTSPQYYSVHLELAGWRRRKNEVMVCTCCMSHLEWCLGEFLFLCNILSEWGSMQSHSIRCVNAHTISLLVVQIIVYVDSMEHRKRERKRKIYTQTHFNKHSIISVSRLKLDTVFQWNGSSAIEIHTDSNHFNSSSSNGKCTSYIFSHDEVKITWNLFLLTQPPDLAI